MALRVRLSQSVEELDVGRGVTTKMSWAQEVLMRVSPSPQETRVLFNLQSSLFCFSTTYVARHV